MTAPAAPVLRHTQFIVRLGEPGDAEGLRTYLLANRSAFAPVEPRRPENFYSLEFCLMRLALNRSHYQEGRSVSMLVFEPDNRTVIGTINFTNLVGYPYHGATLGYSLAQTHWGRGLMREALTLTLAWIFESHNLHRVTANHLPDNERSARLLARLGFRREGYAPDYLLIDGVWRDHVLTALTSDTWTARDTSAELVWQGTGRPSPI
ncbi:GNAT family N-acetyltransferase [Chitinimonas sp.]|uniref:GNAT family N-acetyltransferase n=1 Tax=Chitinimonas sp. TaxID=1934313 RepID=UPI002F95F2C4